jgi:hypothetical protein
MSNKNINVLMDLYEIDKKCFYLSDAINNNIIEYGKFYKINYSNDTVNLNALNINIKFVLTNAIINNNRKIYQFTIDEVDKTSIIDLEKNLLKLCKFDHNEVYKLENIMSSGYFKLKTANKTDIIKLNKEHNIQLSITGIWEINNNIGINFKFIHL